ncbi:MAG: hypothetical protein LBQ93_10950 [Treponema sp.]|jgi:hypothetical protein|nr:hypothetical protein [Treponema sp.]
MSELKLSIEIVAAVGSFLSGIVMLITMIRVVSRLKFKDEVVYGTEARLRYDKIKDTLLKNGIEIERYEFEGGNNKIIPRLEFEKCHYNSLLMEPKLKGYKKRVRFFYKEGEKRYVKTWYLK